jgi:hypothetical protein
MAVTGDVFKELQEQQETGKGRSLGPLLQNETTARPIVMSIM